MDLLIGFVHARLVSFPFVLHRFVVSAVSACLSQEFFAWIGGHSGGSMFFRPVCLPADHPPWHMQEQRHRMTALRSSYFATGLRHQMGVHKILCG